LTFHIRHHWWALDASPEVISFDSLNNDIRNCFIGTDDTWMYLKQKGEKLLPQANFILISEGFPEENTVVKGAPQFILSSNLKSYHVREWREWCERNRYEYYCISEQGALSVRLNPEGAEQSALAVLKGLFY